MDLEFPPLLAATKDKAGPKGEMHVYTRDMYSNIHMHISLSAESSSSDLLLLNWPGRNSKKQREPKTSNSHLLLNPTMHQKSVLRTPFQGS